MSIRLIKAAVASSGTATVEWIPHGENVLPGVAVSPSIDNLEVQPTGDVSVAPTADQLAASHDAVNVSLQPTIDQFAASHSGPTVTAAPTVDKLELRLDAIGVAIAISNSVTLIYEASDSLTVPTGVASMALDCWAGGGGGGLTPLVNGSGGGGGGGYAKRAAQSVAGGEVLAITVGIGGIDALAGGNSKIVRSAVTLIEASGGGGGATGGAGGQGAGGAGGAQLTGDAGAGHTGGNGGGGSAAQVNGGGGGGGAGDANDGTNGASNQAHGVGGVAGGGDGGDGAGGLGVPASVSFIKGGGGGGASTLAARSNGSRGEMRLTFVL